MGIFQIAGIALLSAMLMLLLRELRAGAVPPLRLVTALFLCGAALALYAPVLARIRTLFSIGGGGAFAETVLRAVGIALIAEFSASFCRDLGEPTVGEGILLFGKLEILVLALPLVDELIEIVGDLLK